MRQQIAKPGQRSPVDFWVQLLEVLRQALGRFGHHLEISQDRVLRLAVRQECSASFGRIFFYPVDTIPYMGKVQVVIFQNCTASARIRSRIIG
jgi:hypothetical protein